MNKFLDIVQKLNIISIMDINQQQLDILRKVSKNPKLNQRKLANDLNLSIGKVNYVLKELKKKGLIKIQNFKNNPKKTGYFYLLTPMSCL